jgi:hypothetical protein
LLGKNDRIKFGIPSISLFYKAFKDGVVFG